MLHIIRNTGEHFNGKSDSKTLIQELIYLPYFGSFKGWLPTKPMFPDHDLLEDKR